MTTAPAAINLDLALQLAGRGWYVFPCKPDKTPYTEHGKDNATKSEGQIKQWWQRWPDALIGVYCERSGFFALDIDNKDGRNGARTFQELIETNGGGQAFEVGPVQDTPSGGQHLLFNLPAGVKIPNNANKLGPGLDLRSNGYICTGGPYAWLPGHGPDEPLTDAPAWLLELIRGLTRPATQHSTHTPAALPEDTAGHWLAKALDQATEGNRNDTGFWLACQLRDHGAGEGEAEATMREYARRVPGEGYTEAEAMASLREAYKSPARGPARRVGAPIYSGNGNGNGHHPTGEITEQPPTWWPQEENQPAEVIHLTDLGNGRRFAQQHAGKVCYVDAWGWLVWDGRRWERDETGQVNRLAKRTVSGLFREAEHLKDRAKQLVKTIEQANEANDLQAVGKAQLEQADIEAMAAKVQAWAIKSQSAPRLAAMISKECGRSEPEMVARVDDFDKNAWLLNVQNGVLDLRTGELRPHDPALRLTKIAGAAYDPEATCPTWLEFLDRIFAGDQALIDFMQRAAGYSLTGDVREQALFFLYGTGANGKSTFTGALQELLGDYSLKIRSETLMVKKNDTIPEEIAQLAGARFVLAAELGEGQRLNESLVKDLTGYTDKVRGRLLYRDSFEFYPVAKPWLYGNHKPTIRGTDDGIWRRVKLIPFEVRIPEAEQDKDLPNKLRAELPGILAWCVAGCLEWQRLGLQPPKEVTAATAAFRAEQDLLAAFMDECCILSDLASVTHSDLYSAYKKWAEQNNITPANSVAFSRSLDERGYSTKNPDGTTNKKSSGPGRGRACYKGIGLLTTEENPQ